MFASKSLPEHLVRGVAGMAAGALAAFLAPAHPLVALALVAFALVALRGCPTCWTIGLVQTVVARARGAPARRACAFGRCDRPSSTSR
jgi:hypothetical protein